MTGSIKLNFINNSNDTNNSEIVIFQKNAVADFEDVAVAWKVIKNCGKGWSHPFEFSTTLQLSASDAFGNYSPRQEVQSDQRFQVAPTETGAEVRNLGQSSNKGKIVVENALLQGPIHANFYRSGKLLAKATLPPRWTSLFEFKPTIWIGAVSQIEEGQLLDAAVRDKIKKEISLSGVKSADIVMTGGGPGPNATPFEFTLQNVVMM